MELQHLSPHDVEPLYLPRSNRQLGELVASMTAEGWLGRALLVIEADSIFYAWTGSHRIAAAREAKLTEIPCYVVPEERIAQHGVTATRGHCDDSDRLAVIQKTGDDTAIFLMWSEGRTN